MTKLEKLAEEYSKGIENQALTYASLNCPSDIGMKNKYECTLPNGGFEAKNCVKCWLEEYKDEQEG